MNMTCVMTPVAKEALRAQVLRLQPLVAPYYEEEIRKFIESRIPHCAWLKRNRTYQRALAVEEENIWSYLHILRGKQKQQEGRYKTLLVACDNAVDVVHLDFETLKRIFG
jgi:hypothetical protein